MFEGLRASPGPTQTLDFCAVACQPRRRGHEPAAQREALSHAAAPAGSLHYAGGSRQPGTLTQEDSASGNGPSSLLTSLLTSVPGVGPWSISEHRPSVSRHFRFLGSCSPPPFSFPQATHSKGLETDGGEGQRNGRASVRDLTVLTVTF